MFACEVIHIYDKQDAKCREEPTPCFVEKKPNVNDRGEENTWVMSYHMILIPPEKKKEESYIQGL